MVESEQTSKEFESFAASSNPSLLQFYNQHFHQNEAKLGSEEFKLYEVRVSSCLQFSKLFIVGACLMLPISVADISGPFARIVHFIAWSRRGS